MTRAAAFVPAVCECFAVLRRLDVEHSWCRCSAVRTGSSSSTTAMSRCGLVTTARESKKSRQSAQVDLRLLYLGILYFRLACLLRKFWGRNFMRIECRHELSVQSEASCGSFFHDPISRPAYSMRLIYVIMAYLKQQISQRCFLGYKIIAFSQRDWA